MSSWLTSRHRRLTLVCALAVVWALADVGDQAARSVWAAGPLDETAHFLTGLLVVWAAGGAIDRLAPWVLFASVAIDLDHLPGDLGAHWLTAGDPRPYPHSLLTVALVALVGAVWPRARTACAGLGLGLLVHFWRDLSEPGSGVGLLWPISPAPFSLSHVDYVVGMVVVIALALRHAAAGPVWPARMHRDHGADRSTTPRRWSAAATGGRG